MLPLPPNVSKYNENLRQSRSITNSEVLVNDDGYLSDGGTFREHMSYRKRIMEEIRRKQEQEE